MFKLRVRESFEAGHYLSWHERCCKQHGHTYHVEFVVGSEQLGEHDIVMDLGVLKGMCREIVGRLDHGNLNDIFPNPTVEVVGGYLYDTLVMTLPRALRAVRVLEVTVWETDTGGFTHEGP